MRWFNVCIACAAVGHVFWLTLLATFSTALIKCILMVGWQYYFLCFLFVLGLSVLGVERPLRLEFALWHWVIIKIECGPYYVGVPFYYGWLLLWQSINVRLTWLVCTLIDTMCFRDVTLKTWISYSPFQPLDQVDWRMSWDSKVSSYFNVALCGY